MGKLEPTNGFTDKDFEAARVLWQKINSQNTHASKVRRKIFRNTAIAVFGIELIVTAVLVALNFEAIRTWWISELPVLLIVVAVLIVFGLVISFLVVAILDKTSSALESDYTKYQNLAKKLVAKQLESIFTDVEYSPSRGIDKKELVDTELINTGNLYSSHDLVEAKYRGTEFKLANVQIKQKKQRKAKDGRIEETVTEMFRGQFLILNAPKKINFKMLVSFSESSGYFNPKTNKGLSLMTMESIDFNKHFLVYAEDGFEAFYVLNPAFMENLEQLAKDYHDRISLYFSGEKLFVGLNNRQEILRTPDAGLPAEEQAFKQGIIDETKFVTRVIDDLKILGDA